MKNLKEAFAKLLTGINVKSFDKEYSGDMYDLISFGNGSHTSISNMCDLGNNQYALIHMESKNGAYRDILFPSMKIVRSQGNHEDIDIMLDDLRDIGQKEIWRVLWRRKKLVDRK